MARGRRARARPAGAPRRGRGTTAGSSPPAGPLIDFANRVQHVDLIIGVVILLFAAVYMRAPRRRVGG